MTEQELNKKIDDLIEEHYMDNTTCKVTAERITAAVRTYDRKAIVKIYEKWKADYRKVFTSMEKIKYDRVEQKTEYFIVNCYTNKVKHTINVLYETHAEAKEVVRNNKEVDQKNYIENKLYKIKYEIVCLVRRNLK